MKMEKNRFMLFSLLSLEKNLMIGQNPKLHTTERRKSSPVILTTIIDRKGVKAPLLLKSPTPLPNPLPF